MNDENEELLPAVPNIVPQAQAGEVAKLLAIKTVSVAGHPLAVIVQMRLVVVPAVTPVTVDVGLVGEVIVPAPLNLLQVPLPTEGGVASKVKVELLH